MSLEVIKLEGERALSVLHGLEARLDGTDLVSRSILARPGSKIGSRTDVLQDDAVPVPPLPLPSTRLSRSTASRPSRSLARRNPLGHLDPPDDRLESTFDIVPMLGTRLVKVASEASSQIRSFFRLNVPEMLHVSLVSDDDDRYWAVRADAKWGSRGLRMVGMSTVSTAHGRGFFFHTSDSFDNLLDSLKGISRADRVDDEESFSIPVKHPDESLLVGKVILDTLKSTDRIH